MEHATTIREDTGRRHAHKYANKNPLHRLALGRFHDEMADVFRTLKPSSVLDFGCGEGFLVDKLSERGVEVSGYLGLDLREDAIAEAKSRHPEKSFVCADIFEWEAPAEGFDLVVASQVMEHLIEPERFSPRLGALASGRVLLTVPHEPWFQLVNLARGRDLIRLGNHPEHVNHWNASTFEAFLAPSLEVERMWTAFPFVFALAAPK